MLGRGSTTPGLGDPAPVSSLSDAVEVSVGYTDSAGIHPITCARRASGGVACWGDNGLGQLGTTAVAIGSATGVPVALPGITTAVQISVGRNASCARLADGHVSC